MLKSFNDFSIFLGNQACEKGRAAVRPQAWVSTCLNLWRSNIQAQVFFLRTKAESDKQPLSCEAIKKLIGSGQYTWQFAALAGTGIDPGLLWDSLLATLGRATWFSLPEVVISQLVR